MEMYNSHHNPVLEYFHHPNNFRQAQTQPQL